MISLNNMLTLFTQGGALSEHYAFYLRGVLNSVTPTFIRPDVDRLITENEVSGEYIEALRIVADRLAPNLQEGETVSVGYKNVRDALGDVGGYYKDFDVDSMAKNINNTLGKFKITMKDGQRIVDHDAYDFPTELEDRIQKEEGRKANTLDYLKQGYEILTNDEQFAGLNKKVHYGAHLAGEYFMPDTDDDSLKVRIAIPNEPTIIATDYDDDIPETANNFSFSGPMTTKRKSIFDAFISSAQASTNDNVDPILKNDLSTFRALQVEGKSPFPMDGNDEEGRMNEKQIEIMEGDASVKQPAPSFGQAFSKARSDGLDTFTFKGKEYTTETA
jgi:hypothetical protein